MNVFCIGLPKTGTTSLQKAILELGYELKGEFVREVDDLKEVSDDPNAKHFYRLSRAIHDYEELDSRFPGSKFIITTRDYDSWLKSCRHQFRHPCEPGSDVYEGRMRLFGTPEYSDEGFKAAYDRHLAAVRAYFAGRDDDLLVMAAAAGEGFDVLCPFLGEPMRDAEFPKENVGRSWKKLYRRLKQYLPGQVNNNARWMFRASAKSDE